MMNTVLITLSLNVEIMCTVLITKTAIVEMTHTVLITLILIDEMMHTVLITVPVIAATTVLHALQTSTIRCAHLFCLACHSS